MLVQRLIDIQVSEFLSLFLLTRFVIPLPSKFSCFSCFANLSTADSCSMHFSFILLLAKLRLSTWHSQIALAKCCTPESVILLFERSSSRMYPFIFKFLAISLICWSPMFRPDKLRQPSYISLLKARLIVDSFVAFLPPAAAGFAAPAFGGNVFCRLSEL